MAAEVPLQNAPVLRAIEDRAPRFQFAHAIRRFLRVQLGHPPIVHVLPAAHRVGEMDAPIIAIVHVRQRRRDAAFRHHGVRFAEERFANHPHRHARGRSFDRRAQARAARANHEHVVLHCYVIRHDSGELAETCARRQAKREPSLFVNRKPGRRCLRRGKASRRTRWCADTGANAFRLTSASPRSSSMSRRQAAAWSPAIASVSTRPASGCGALKPSKCRMVGATSRLLEGASLSAPRRKSGPAANEHIVHVERAQRPVRPLRRIFRTIGVDRSRGAAVRSVARSSETPSPRPDPPAFRGAPVRAETSLRFRCARKSRLRNPRPAAIPPDASLPPHRAGRHKINSSRHSRSPGCRRDSSKAQPWSQPKTPPSATAPATAIKRPMVEKP